MDTRTLTRPPRLAEALLRRCLPVGAAGLTILGDLREDYQARHAAGTRARLWYWREALLLSARYVTSRHQAGRRTRSAWTVTHDLRIAVRTLRRSPATSSIIVLTLGIAIGASTVGFSFADFALLRGLPVDDPRQVIAIYGIDVRQANGRARVSPANFADLRRRLTTVERLSALLTNSATYLDRGVPASLDAGRVTADFFLAIGQRPHVGRLFLTGDDQPTAAPVVVLAHHYWQRAHEASPAVLGQTIVLDGQPRTIVGVASPDLEMGNLAAIDLWIPLEVAANASRADAMLTLMGRLKPGATVAEAQAEVAVVGKALVEEFPLENKDWQATLVPLFDVAYGRGFWVIISLFIAAVVLVMVIACANAASLVLARATARRREMALRSALGAGRARLLRQALIEGFVLSLFSAAIAIPAAELGLRMVRTFDTPEFQQLRIDFHEISFVAVISVLTPILFAVLPTLSAIRFDLRTALQSGGVRSGVSTRGRATLVTVQLAMAVTLLLSSGLAIRTAINITNLNVGIRTSEALIFAIDLKSPVSPIAHPLPFIDTMRERLARLPGVVSVNAFESFPVLGGERIAALELSRDTPAGDVQPWAILNGATAGALPALGVRLVAGRFLSDADVRGVTTATVMGETAATMYFGSVDAALGQTFIIKDGSVRRRADIVGVVSDVLSNDIERGAVPRVWTGFQPERPRAAVVVVTAGDASGMANATRLEMAAVAPMLPLEGLETVDAAFARFRASDQGVIAIFAGFAGLALVLAAAGLYGLITYMVSLRISEFGTRFALGARRLDVLRLVFGQVARLIAIGLALGLTGGLLVGQMMRRILFGVSATDPVTIAAVVTLIALVATIASVRPALRAARLNLVDALRSE